MEEDQVQSLQGGWELDTLGRAAVRVLLISNFLPIQKGGFFRFRKLTKLMRLRSEQLTSLRKYLKLKRFMRSKQSVLGRSWVGSSRAMLCVVVNFSEMQLPLVGSPLAALP